MFVSYAKWIEPKILDSVGANAASLKEFELWLSLKPKQPSISYL